MDAGAVDERERSILLIEGQCKIGSSKHDCLRAPLLEQLLTNSIEDQTLGVSHNTGRRHRNVGLVHIVQVLSAWRDDLGASDASIESRLHHCASSEDSDPFEATSFDGPANFGNHVDNGQWGCGLEGVDAKVSGNRSDNDTFCTRRNKAVREPRIDGYLRCSVIAYEIAKCPFRNFLNRLNQLDFKGGGLIRGGVADVDA
jgi:hypothetical protein